MCKDEILFWNITFKRILHGILQTTKSSLLSAGKNKLAVASNTLHGTYASTVMVICQQHYYALFLLLFIFYDYHCMSN